MFVMGGGTGGLLKAYGILVRSAGKHPTGEGDWGVSSLISFSLNWALLPKLFTKSFSLEGLGGKQPFKAVTVAMAPRGEFPFSLSELYGLDFLPCSRCPNQRGCLLSR